jgi:hypothetical protein
MGIPSASHYTYNTFRVIPFPIRVNNTNNKYIFIQPENEVVLSDTTKQYYFKLSVEDVAQCNIMQRPAGYTELSTSDM